MGQLECGDRDGDLIEGVRFSAQISDVETSTISAAVYAVGYFLRVRGIPDPVLSALNGDIPRYIENEGG